MKKQESPGFSRGEEVKTIHVCPENDVIDHTTDSDDCICGPAIEPVPREDGSMGWLVIHHSLDGRENREPSG